MDIAELIRKCGVENVGVQFLDECADKIDWNHKKGTKITFGSDVRVGPRGTDKLGVVVWLDREAVQTAIDEKKDARHE